MRKLIVYVVACAVSLTVSLELLASSANNHKLYQAEVIVKDRSRLSWRRGVKKALNEVFVKATGNETINTIPALQEASGDLSTLVQSYSYHRKSVYGHVSQLFLKVSFDRAEIRQVLDNARQTVWSEQRPVTLVWLAMQTGVTKTEILSRDQHQKYVAVLKETAQRRGIPIVLPTMDTDDISMITVKDVWGFNVPLLAEVGKRYQTDSFLVVRMRFGDDQLWHAKCVWVKDGQSVEWTLQHEEFDDLLGDVVERLTSKMAARSVTLRSVDIAHTILMRVVGVDGIDGYTKVIAYLKKLTPVKDVELNLMESGSVILSVSYDGDQEMLQKAILNAKDHRLSEVSFDDQLENNSDNISLIYHWNTKGA